MDFFFASQKYIEEAKLVEGSSDLWRLNKHSPVQPSRSPASGALFYDVIFGRCSGLGHAKKGSREIRRRKLFFEKTQKTDAVNFGSQQNGTNLHYMLEKITEKSASTDVGPAAQCRINAGISLPDWFRFGAQITVRDTGLKKGKHNNLHKSFANLICLLLLQDTCWWWRWKVKAFQLQQHANASPGKQFPLA